MASPTFGVNDANAVKLWSKRLDVEALKQTWFSKFIGESTSSLAQVMSDTNKGPGDRVRWSLRMLLSGAGTTEGQVQEGNEEAPTWYYDEMFINELGHAVRVPTDLTIDQQRVPWDLRDQGFEGLRDWWADRWDTMFFNQLCGNTAQTDLRYTANNVALAPSANRIIRPASATTDQALNSSTYNFTLNMLDRASVIAKTASPQIRPIMVDGAEHYVAFLHPNQVYTLRSDTSTTGNWFDLQKASLQGGSIKDNPIFTGAIGMYNNIIIHESYRITQGVHSTAGTAVSNTRRAVLAGAQALGVATGQKNSPTKYSWVEETFDYERKFGVRASSILGIKKTRYNSEDFGTIVMSTYAAAP